MFPVNLHSDHTVDSLHLFLAGIHGRQQMHRRASQTARGGTAKCPKVRASSDFWGRCFIASGHQQLPAIHSQTQAAEQCCLVLSVRQALYAVLEKCFLCWKHPKKCQTKGGLWSQCGVDWGHFSWRSFGEDLPRQWEWRAYGDANLMTLSPPCSYRPIPSSDALAP